MSDNDNDDALLNPNPIFSRKPWVGIVVPICVVAGIGVAVLTFVILRRRNRRRRVGVFLNQQGRLALERDILADPEAGRDGGYRGGSGSTSSGGHLPPPRTVNRWAWAHNINLATISGLGGRRDEEGLNELGEAPPPYYAPKSAAALGGSAAIALGERPVVACPPPVHQRGSSDGDTIICTAPGAITGTTAGTTTTTAATSARSRTTSYTFIQPVSTSSVPPVLLRALASPPAYCASNASADAVGAIGAGPRTRNAAASSSGRHTEQDPTAPTKQPPMAPSPGP